MCEKEGITDKPCTRTLWNIINQFPASQRKSLAGLDNVAAEGSDAFDSVFTNLQKIQAKNPILDDDINTLIDNLSRGKRYLKGEYKVNCSSLESQIADHCRQFALSDPNIPEFMSTCSHKHDMKCDNCELLKVIYIILILFLPLVKITKI